MKIAQINENSQAAKNGIIEAALKQVVEPGDFEIMIGHDSQNVKKATLTIKN